MLTAIEQWKYDNPLFVKTNRVNSAECLMLQNDILSPQEELDYIKRCMPDLANLMVDIQVSANDLFPKLILRLMTKRSQELKIILATKH